MSTKIKNGKVIKDENRINERIGKYVEVRKAARKGAAFNDIIPENEPFPYISDEKIDRLLYRLSREYALPGFTEGLLILVYATAPKEIRDDDDKLLRLANFYVDVETARNDTEGLLGDDERNLALYF